MPRSTVYHRQVTEEKWEAVNYQNKELLKDFVSYLTAVDKSPATIMQYEHQLRTFFVFVSEQLGNKFFVDLKKRDFIKYFGYLTNQLEESPSRISSLRAVLSSLSNYIERMLDDEFPDFRNLVKVLEPVHKVAVREKTILTTEQVDACLAKLVKDKKYQIACALALLASSGMRRSEALQMKVDFFKNENLIFNGIAYETEKIRTKGRGKVGKVITRIVFVDPFKKYFDLWMKEREKLGIDTEWLFVTKSKGEYRQAGPSTIVSWFTVVSEYMEADVYPHSLRHYETTKLLREGYPQSVVQKLIKWESADMVATYDDRNVNEELNDFMLSVSQKTK